MVNNAVVMSMIVAVWHCVSVVVVVVVIMPMFMTLIELIEFILCIDQNGGSLWKNDHNSGSYDHTTSVNCDKVHNSL